MPLKKYTKSASNLLVPTGHLGRGKGERYLKYLERESLEAINCDHDIQVQEAKKRKVLRNSEMSRRNLASGRESSTCSDYRSGMNVSKRVASVSTGALWAGMPYCLGNGSPGTFDFRFEQDSNSSERSRCRSLCSNAHMQAYRICSM